MAQALRSIETQPAHVVEIVVHITESLGERERDKNWLTHWKRMLASLPPNSVRYAIT